MIWLTLLHVVTVSVSTLICHVVVRLAEVYAIVGDRCSVFAGWLCINCVFLQFVLTCVAAFCIGGEMNLSNVICEALQLQLW